MARLVIVGALAFAVGAAVGALAVKHYVETHAGEITAGKIGEALGFSPGGVAILTGIGSTVDQVRA